MYTLFSTCDCWFALFVMDCPFRLDGAARTQKRSRWHAVHRLLYLKMGIVMYGGCIGVIKQFILLWTLCIPPPLMAISRHWDIDLCFPQGGQAGWLAKSVTTCQLAEITPCQISVLMRYLQQTLTYCYSDYHAESCLRFSLQNLKSALCSSAYLFTPCLWNYWRVRFNILIISKKE